MSHVMGVVSPNGIGNSEVRRRNLTGQEWGGQDFALRCVWKIPVQIAGEFANFDELAWVDKRERKHVSV